MESMEMTPEQMAERLKMVESMCICRSCPTYTNLGEDDEYIVYCFPSRGRSKNISEEKGCTCGVCPVYDEMKFMTAYYCTRDIEMKQKIAIVDEAWKGHSIWDHIRGKR
jgi:hypothetical protein